MKRLGLFLLFLLLCQSAYANVPFDFLTNITTSNLMAGRNNSSGVGVLFNTGLGIDPNTGKVQTAPQESVKGVGDVNFERGRKSGISRATIGKGIIITNSNISNLNRDIAKAQQIVKDKQTHVRVVIPIVDMKQAKRDVKDFGAFLKKVRARAPEKYRGQIDLQRAAYQRLRADGLSDQQASLALQNPKFQSLLAVTDDIARLAKLHGGISNVSDADLYALMKFTFGGATSPGVGIEFSGGAGRHVGVMIVPEGGATPGLGNVLDALEIKRLHQFKQVVETALNDYGKDVGGDAAKINLLATVYAGTNVLFPTSVLDVAPGLKAFKGVARLSRELRSLKNLSGKTDEAARLARMQQYGAGIEKPKTVDSILTGTHKYDKPSLNERINQRADFSSGATHITSGKKLDELVEAGKTETIGNPRQLYVLPTYQADKLLNRKGVTKADIEKTLGLDSNSLVKEPGPVTRFDIRNPEKRNMRMPDPATGNQYHRPRTGLTAGGQTERVINTPKLNDPGVTRTDLNIQKGAK